MTDRMNKFAAALAVSLGLASGYATGAVVNSPTDDTGRWEVSTAIVRLGDPIYVHADDWHTSVGIEGWFINDYGNIVIENKTDVGWSNEYVGACQVTLDETLAKLGIFAGCSGGRKYTQVWMYRDGKRIYPDDPMFGSDKANLWVRTERFVPGGYK